MFELLGRQETSVGAEVFVEGRALSARNVTGDRVDRLDFTAESRFGTRIDQGHLFPGQARLQLLGADQQRMIRLAGEMATRATRRIQAQRLPRRMPGLEPAIEQVHAVALAQPRQ